MNDGLGKKTQITGPFQELCSFSLRIAHCTQRRALFSLVIDRFLAEEFVFRLSAQMKMRNILTTNN